MRVFMITLTLASVTLAGTLLPSKVHAVSHAQEISLESCNHAKAFAKLVLEKHIGKNKIDQISVNQIIKMVALTMKVKEKAIIGKGRNMEVALARQVCMYLAKKLINTSLANIGKQIGKRDHSTVIHACKNIEQKILKDASIKMIIKKIETNLTK